MSYYSNLKKNRKNAREKLRKRAESESSGGNDNPNQWRLTRDKSDNGFAIIRFLPASEKDFNIQATAAKTEGITLDPEDVVPWVLVFKHGFRVKGRWFINECPRTIGNECPVCEIEAQKIEDGIGWAKEYRDHEDRKIYGQRKGKKNYWSNILVVKDSANPENEGKVFLFCYGEKIHEKLVSAMNPEFEDEAEMNPFCPWEGANFKLKAKRKDGYVNYDSSAFEEPESISDDDDEIFAILEKTHTLNDLVAPKVFKSYDALLKQYKRTVEGAPAGARTSVDDDDTPHAEKNLDKKVNEDDEGSDEPKKDSKTRKPPKDRKPPKPKDEEPPFDTDENPEPATEPEKGDDDGDDDMAYFQSILDDD